jgi:uncharacterized protein YjeT (DUF2065 family)
VDRTRRSLYYPASYLLGGFMFLVVPELALRLMLSNGDYDDAIVRFVGALTVGLGMIVVQIIRHRLEPIYPTIIWVRVFFCACYIALWVSTRDPLFLVLLVMVGLGVTGTTLGWLKDRRAPA